MWQPQYTCTHSCRPLLTLMSGAICFAAAILLQLAKWPRRRFGHLEGSLQKSTLNTQINAALPCDIYYLLICLYIAYIKWSMFKSFVLCLSAKRKYLCCKSLRPDVVFIFPCYFWSSFLGVSWLVCLVCISCSDFFSSVAGSSLCFGCSQRRGRAAFMYT